MAKNVDSFGYAMISFWIGQMPKDWSLFIISNKIKIQWTQNGHTNELKSEVNGINWQH